MIVSPAITVHFLRRKERIKQCQSLEDSPVPWSFGTAGILVEIAEVVACTIRVVKMRKHLLFYRELSILCIGDRVVVDRFV